MALSRKMLEDMGIEDANVSKIINAHRETVDGLKEEIAGNEKEIDTLKSANKELEGKVSEVQDKFDKEHSDFEEYKKAQADKDVIASKEKAYKELLKEAGVSEKRFASILKITDLEKLELDKDGKFKDSDKLTDSIKNEWADFIVETETKGATTPKPKNTEGGHTKTKEEIDAIKDAAERQKAMAENLELYGIE